MARRISDMIRSLPRETKLTAIGSVLLAISVFLPWYSDKDIFNTGYTFLGITGPLYLVGISLLVVSLLSLWFLFSEKGRRKLESFSLEPSAWFTIYGIASLFLLVLVNTVYFHNKFGINISLKEFRFGMLLAFIAAGMILAGGIMMKKSQAKDYDDIIGSIEPLIEMKPREHQPIEPEPRETEIKAEGPEPQKPETLF